MFNALIRMMDVPTALAALAQHMRGRGLTRGGALLIFTCCLLIFGPLAYIWWRFDLHSTWNWFDWMLTGAQADVAGGISAVTEQQVTPQDDSARVVLILFGAGFTLLPSAIQLGLSRFVSIPGLGFLVKVALGFDLITDFGPMWALAEANAWYAEAFKWGPLVQMARFVGTVLGTVLASFVVQSAVILLLAVMLYMVGVIVTDGRSAAPRRATIVEA